MNADNNKSFLHNYAFELEKHTTLTHYSSFAKQQRYGKPTLLPEKIDFIEQSNSQTVRMCFNMTDIPASAGACGHVFSIHIDPAVLSEFEQKGFLFGVKLSLNRKQWGLRVCYELFQSLHKHTHGALSGVETPGFMPLPLRGKKNSRLRL